MAGAVRLFGTLVRGLIAAVVLAALVVGLPWALVHYVGWPLPRHVPTGPELQGFLLAPMSATFLLDFLACACWLVWFLFTLDVLRCAAQVVRDARWPDLSEAGPMHTLAGVLVGAVLLSVLANRPTPVSSSPSSAASGTVSTVVTTAPAWPNTPSPGTVTVRQMVFTTSTAKTTATAVSTPAAPTPMSIIVQAPENGVHDSLWRIAQRTLGDGNRWPEIWHANQGKPQPGGRSFTRPSLIYPGQELDLPAIIAATAPGTAPVNTPPPAPESASAPPGAAPAPTTPPPASSPAATPAPTTQHAPTTSTDSPSSTREPGVQWGPDLFVGLGLTAAVSAALLVARRRHHARYQPGSGDREDFPIAPVVYRLRLAHLRTAHDDEIDLDGVLAPHGVVPAARVIGVPENSDDQEATQAARLGVRDNQEIALNLATARGLGLVGAGSPAATRALLVTALSISNHIQTGATRTRVVVPDEDLVPLLGRAAANSRLPTSLHVADSLDGALDALEAEILVRAGTTPEEKPRSWPTLVLAATVPEHQRPRLQAVLDNGSPFGITGLLLGQWQPGVTAYIRADGTVSATSPGLGEQLRGARMYRVDADNTAALLELLHQADPEASVEDEALAAPRPQPRVAPPTARSAFQTTAVDTEHTSAIGSGQPSHDTEPETISQPPASAPAIRPHPCPASRQPFTGTARTTTAPDTDEAGDGKDLGARQETLVHIEVLGAPRVFWRAGADAVQVREVTGSFQPRTRELLIFLALHPDGASREALVAALWPDTPVERTTNALNTALSRLRRSISTATGGELTEIVVAGENRYRLDPELVDVDYWRFDAAIAARRAAATDQQRMQAYRAIVDSYGGSLADGMSTEWLETAREAIRRDAIDAVAELAHVLAADSPQQTLDLLEIARAFDPHNEALYRDIMQLQGQLGQHDAVVRTMTLLTARLAEIDDRPTARTIEVFNQCRQHDQARGGNAPVDARGNRHRSA
ncbi:BTAD domain-containing putative transcriptional regulator [Kutzneria sp. 744]|uniref:BTAD domain-containing putative transcriptional regulator n=1 Tax=Kutzneria sp. (strain 744) TaxID=345341 RepID=UPI0003EEA61E|nr:BTAD domain-containing putative transcriptional regulator [Kutzneria sp. 744]EWM12036.1 response regulator receiver [Kutzneria sp. 744]